MKDKFGGTVRDRFEFHRESIMRELEGLRGLHADHIDALSPDFWVQLEAAKAAMNRMEELVEELDKGE